MCMGLLVLQGDREKGQCKDTGRAASYHEEVGTRVVLTLAARTGYAAKPMNTSFPMDGN